MTPVQIAMQAVDAAVAHRATISVKISNTASTEVIEQYEQAVQAEHVARKSLGRVLDAEKAAQMRAAGLTR